MAEVDTMTQWRPEQPSRTLSKDQDGLLSGFEPTFKQLHIVTLSVLAEAHITQQHVGGGVLMQVAEDTGLSG
ncbi:ATPase family AAA domain containing protein 5, partial [Dissostichus eleginoides]